MGCKVLVRILHCFGTWGGIREAGDGGCAKRWRRVERKMAVGCDKYGGGEGDLSQKGAAVATCLKENGGKSWRCGEKVVTLLGELNKVVETIKQKHEE